MDKIRGNVARAERLEVGALCIASAMDACSLATMPLWSAAVIKSGSFTTVEVGRVATAELVAMTVGVIAITLTGLPSRRRFVLLSLSLIVSVANLMASLISPITFVIGRILSGLGVGIISAISLPMLACRENAQKTVNLASGSAMLCLSIIYLISPALLGRFGQAGIFCSVCFLSLVTAAAVFIGVPVKPSILKALPARQSHVTNATWLLPATTCLGWGVVAFGQAAVSFFSVGIGQNLGFTQAQIGTLLAAALPMTMLASVIGHFLGERLGLLAPIYGGLLLLSIDIMYVVHAANLAIFYVGIVGLNLLFVFAGIYSTAYLGVLDRSGRFVNTMRITSLGGGALGPMLGSALVARSGFSALALTSTASVIVGLAIIATGTHPRALPIDH
jgi:MFS family permease